MSTPAQKGSRPGRNRIVINIEGAQGGGASGSRRGSGGGWRALGIVAIALLVIALSIIAGLYFWWQSYKTRPAYSLALMVDAVQRNDQAAFDEIVDTDKIVDNFVPYLAERAGAGYAGGVSAPLRRQLDSALTRVMPQVKERIREELANQIKDLSSRAESKPFLLVALATPFVVDINQEGDAATVKANLKERPVELTMQRSGTRWRVVAVKDARGPHSRTDCEGVSASEYALRAGRSQGNQKASSAGRPEYTAA
jgi:hypothetical protein